MTTKNKPSEEWFNKIMGVEEGKRTQKENDVILGWREFNCFGGHDFKPLKVKKVIYNDPATIILWNDGTKTVVKCMEGDIFSQEMGLAMCICKKVLGSQYHRVFKEWITYEPE